jgi:hypothetical protein
MIPYTVVFSNIFDYMMEKNLEDLSTVDSPRNKNGVWGLLCIKCTGEYTFRDSVYIQSLWRGPNKSNLSFNVKRALQEKRSPTVDVDFEVECLKATSTTIYGINSNNINLSYSRSEWEDLVVNHTAVSDGRKRFKVFFDNMLTEKLQENGVNCCLSNNWNWFKASTIQGVIWNASYKCIYEHCRNIFKCIAKKRAHDNDISLVVSWNNNESVHEKITKVKRFEGVERKKIKGKQFTFFQLKHALGKFKKIIRTENLCIELSRNSF